MRLSKNAPRAISIRAGFAAATAPTRLAYAIFGNVTPSGFCEKAAGAMPTPNSAPGSTPEYS